MLPLIDRLKTWSPWYLLGISLVLSEIGWAIVVSLISLLLRGHVAWDYLVTGVVAAFFTGLLVVGVILALIRSLQADESTQRALSGHLQASMRAQAQNLQAAQALLDASATTNSSLNLGEVLLSLAGQLVRLSGFDTCTIHEWVPGAERLRSLAEHTRCVWKPDFGEVYRVADYPTTALTLATGQPHMVHAGADDPELAWMDRLGLANLLMLPMQVEDTVVGLVEIGNADVTQPFDQQAALRCQHVLQAASPGLRAPLWANPGHVLIELAGRLRLAANGAVVSLSAWEEAAGILRTVAEHADLTWPPGEGTTLALAAFPSAARALQVRQPAVIRLSDATIDMAYRQQLFEWGARSLALLPLAIRDQPIGLISLYNATAERSVGPDELRLWQAVADQAAAAVENARLHAETERRLHWLNRTSTSCFRSAVGSTTSTTLMTRKPGSA